MIRPTHLWFAMAMFAVVLTVQPGGHVQAEEPAVAVTTQQVEVTHIGNVQSIRQILLGKDGFMHPIMPGGRCGHVISRLIHSPMHDRFAPPELQDGAIAGSPIGPVLVQPLIGDLELLTVQQAADATPESGPIFAVTLRNNGRTDVRGFHISLVAVLGQINPASPTTNEEIECLKAGETMTVEIPLPMSAMAITTPDQRIAPFETLVVAIDSLDEWAERSELNNIAVMARGEIVAITAAPAAAVTETVETTEPNAAAPAPAQPANPLDNLNLDSLELEDAEASGLFNRQ